MDELNFNRGMSAVIAPDILPDGMAALITDMYLDDSGELVRLGGAQAFTDVNISFDIGAVKIYEWKSANMPIDYDDSMSRVIYVAFCVDGAVKYGYFRAGSLNWEDISYYVIGSNVMASHDSTQFVWVDGRDNSMAARIAIDQEGIVSCAVIGIAAPGSKAVLVDIVISTESDIGTGMSCGSILTYAYCYVNAFGERSNPSPLLCIDSFAWQQRGYYEEDSSLYGARSGSIKSVSLSVAIDATDIAKVELYRGFSEYAESNIPEISMKQVSSVTVQAGAKSLSIVDSAFGSAIEISYENDVSPKGDDIVILAGTTFIANAVASKALVDADIHRVTITNSNQFNYVNEWFRIDFHDKVSRRDGEAFLDIDWDNIDINNVRILANDLTTSIECYFYDRLDLPMSALDYSCLYEGRCVAWVRVPYVAAYSETDFYLCIFAGNVPDRYASMGVMRTDSEERLAEDMHMLWDGRVPQIPARNQNHILAQTRQRGTSDLPNTVRDKIDVRANKANILYPPSPAINNDEYAGLTMLFDERYSYRQNSDVDIPNVLSEIAVNESMVIDNNATTFYNYDDGGAMLFPSKGYVSANFQMAKLDTDIPLTLVSLENGNSTIVKIVSSYLNGVFSINAMLIHPGGDMCLEQLFSVQTSYIDNVKFHVYVTWEYSYPREPYELIATARAVYCTHNANNNTWGIGRFSPSVFMGASGTGLYEFIDLRALFLSGDDNGQLVCGGNYQLSGDGYYPDFSSFAAVLRNTPLFPVAPIGMVDNYIWSVEQQVGRIYNDNISFTRVQSSSMSNSPGKIQWGKYGTMPDLNYKMINEEILRIEPESSRVPTDEHNTIVIFTRHKKMRLSLVGANANEAVTIVDYEEIGLTNPNALAITPYGMAWIDDKGIFLDSAGSDPISKEFIPVANSGILFYDRSREWLWYAELDSLGKSKNVYAYIMRKNFWFRCSQDLIPALVTEIGNINIYVNPLYSESAIVGSSAWTHSRSVALAGAVKSKRYIDKARVKRMRVDSSSAAAGTITVYTRGYNTAKSAITLNVVPGQLVATPGLRAAEVEFVLSFESIKRLILEK